MIGKGKLLVAAMLAGVAVSAPASAAQYLLSYASTSGTPMTASLSLTTADTLNAAGGYDVTGISGDVSGDIITGLVANPSQPWSSYSADGLFIIDNVFLPGSPSVSWYGLLFQSASHEYNLFSDNATTYELYQATPGIGYTANSVGTVAAFTLPDEDLGGSGSDMVLAPVPEVGTWMTMLAGFGLVGAAMRLNRRRPVRA